MRDSKKRSYKRKRSNRFFDNRIVLSLFLTLIIISSLVLVNVQPAGAVNLTLPSLPSSMCIGYTYTFYAQIDIDSDELVPINNIRLDINGATPVFALFQVDGTPIDKSAQIIDIEFLGTSNYEDGYLRGTDATYGYDYSWGYGYGYGQAGTDTQLQYRIRMTSTGMTAGAYTAQLTATVTTGSEVFQSVQYPITVRTCGGGGGGGGGGDYAPPFTTDLWGSVEYWSILNTGIIQENVSVASPDGNVSIFIPAGVKLLDSNGDALSGIAMEYLAPLPESPEGHHVLAAFNFEPDGATFDPGFELTITYDPASLPEGFSEENLVIAIYDEATGDWTYLTGTVDAENHTVTFTITHFTIFALMAAPAPEPTATPTPTLVPTITPEPTQTVAPTPTATATPTAVPTVSSGGGTTGKSDLPDRWVLIVIAVAGGVLLAGVIGAIVRRARA